MPTFWDSSIRFDLLMSETIGDLKMGRLDEKFAKAGGVVQRSEKLIEDKLDHLIAREDSVAARTERIFERQHAPLDSAEAALDALESKLDLLSNGGPDGPLPGSGSAPEVATATAATFPEKL